MIDRKVIAMSLDERRKFIPPHTTRITIAASALAVMALFLALIAAPEGMGASFHFHDERGAVAVISALLMAWGGAFAFVTALLLDNESIRTRLFWYLGAIGLVFLSVDELVGFHEAIGQRTPGLGTTGERVFGIFRGWNDIVVILYGVVALIAGLIFLPEVLRPPQMAELLSVGFAFFVVHTVIDSVAEPPSHTSVILEESAKVFCVLFIALGMFTAMRWALLRSGVAVLSTMATSSKKVERFSGSLTSVRPFGAAQK